MSEPCFTLSLDCEGLWGMCDKIDDPKYSLIRYCNLSKTYSFIADTLAMNNIRATAAFVSAFSVEHEFLHDNKVALEEMKYYSPYWFSKVFSLINSGHTDGLIGHDFFKLLKRSGHEIAWHGGTHIPLIETCCTSNLFDLDLDLSKNIFSAYGYRPTSIVFPRNQIGFLDNLHENSFLAYRDSNPRDQLTKLYGYLGEFNMYQPTLPTKHNYYPQGPMLSIPSGYFLNWPRGYRALVPISTTISRWKKLILSTVKKGGALHMWFHPHNLITAPEMNVTFLEIMNFLGTQIKNGSIKNLTMDEIYKEQSRSKKYV